MERKGYWRDILICAGVCVGFWVLVVIAATN